MLKYVGLIISVLSLNHIQAQSVGGKIIDKEDGKALQGVSVSVANASKGTISAETGKYYLTNLSEGKVHLLISYTGYAPIDTLINISSKSDLKIDFALTAEKEALEEVIIVSSSRTNSRIENPSYKSGSIGFRGSKRRKWN